MIKNKRALSLIMASLTMANLFALSGCGKKSQTLGEGDNKLTYFAVLTTAHAGATVDNLADTPLYQKLMERLGVDIEFIHPAAGQTTEQLNLLIASKSLPDIVEYGWNSYPGGPQKAIDDNVIIPIDGFMDNEAKDLKKFLEGDNEFDYDRMVKTQSGQHYVFPFVRGSKKMLTFVGPVVRTDWLENEGLSTPETIEDWDKMLAAFKKRGNDVIPLSIMWNSVFASQSFIGAYGVKKDFYADNDKVVYGPIEPGYRDFLAKMHEWYEKGYIDKDFSTQTVENLEAKVLSGKAGATILMAGSQIGKFVNTINSEKLDIKIAGVSYPSLHKGEVARFGQQDNAFYGFGAAISANCKNPSLAAKVLNYGYTEEGHDLYNFGIEGESYELVDGEPVYTDYITKNPEGLSFAAAAGRYIRAMGDGPFVQDPRYFVQYCALPEQQNAINLWTKADNSGSLPLLLTNDEDTKRFSSIMNDVNTAVDEYSLQVVLGQKSIDTFDSFVAECKRLGIDEAIKIKQNAYNEYKSR